MFPTNVNNQNRFAFLDEGEAIRRLGVDRDTLLTLVREKRLRAYPGVGKGHFFRVRDLDKLAAELRPAAPAPATPLLAPQSLGVRRQHDPAYKVHLRLQADLKWFDIADDDLRAWVRELHPDGYSRQRTNVNAFIAKLERLRALMDEAAAHWQNLPPEEPSGESPTADRHSPPSTSEPE
jgi:hypothetical protein